MKNINEIANELQEAIKGSKDFTELKRCYDDVMADPWSKELFHQFRNLQMELSQKMMQGQEITPEDNMKSQQILSQVQQNVKIEKLKEAEQNMNTLITDLNKVIMNPLEELYKL